MLQGRIRHMVIPAAAGLFFTASAFISTPARADQVIMKDGTVYKGKILIDTDKAILIGNPPFDPNSYLLQADDIEKIIYEEYHQNPPAERKRGLLVEGRLNGLFSSSDQLSYGPAPGLYAGLGFRIHPALELNGGVEWDPTLHSGDSFSVSDGTTTRRYEDFWGYTAVFSARLYPFYGRPWKTEPYLAAGWSWSRQIPKGSGDSVKGSGWHIGFGAIRPISTHVFLESRLIYGRLTFDTIRFLGQEGSIQPEIKQNQFTLSAGLSYRL